ncbi:MULTISPECIES: hypothetical protein [unclassified Streptomyces]|uniref:hypothetical protein n=1 Tax=unclassified Streptomyces TaxID=2593676 RepID=UPI003815058D
MVVATAGLCNSQARVRWPLAEVRAQGFVPFELWPVLLDSSQEVGGRASTAVGFLQGAAEQATAQRARRDQAEAVVAQCGDQFEFDRARVECGDSTRICGATTWSAENSLRQDSTNVCDSPPPPEEPSCAG